jgi:hypothetical protein
MTKISKDTLWKGIIEDLCEDFLLYFFPEWASKEVDFSKGFEFLDKELDELFPENIQKKRYADKIIKVFTKSGKEQWILVHIEVQGYQDKNFTKRMFTYFYRILDRWNKNIMTLAIFTDDNPKYIPSEYVYQYQDTKSTYSFDTFKILNKSEQELNIAQNPFSIVMLTAKKSLEKKNLQDNNQFTWKKELVLALTQQYSGEKTRRILNFIRYYVKFNDNLLTQEFENEIQSIIKYRKSMGIEEAIIQEITEQVTEKVTKRVTKRVTKKVTEKVTEQVTEQVRIQTKISGIQKALERNKLTLIEISEDFEVSLEFIMKVKSGEIK